VLVGSVEVARLGRAGTTHLDDTSGRTALFAPLTWRWQTAVLRLAVRPVNPRPTDYRPTVLDRSDKFPYSIAPQLNCWLTTPAKSG
jgi:hypothetical protein